MHSSHSKILQELAGAFSELPGHDLKVDGNGCGSCDFFAYSDEHRNHDKVGGVKQVVHRLHGHMVEPEHSADRAAEKGRAPEDRKKCKRSPQADAPR